MSLSLDLLNPAAAWWLLLVPALVALYMLRPRSRRMPVPSLRLWRELPQVERPTPRLRRPPLSLLLLLQALLLGAGALALMHPGLPSPAPRQIVVMLDTSGSMQAAQGTTTRFEQARAEAVRLESELHGNDRATLFSVGPTISTLCSSCTQNDYDQALRSVQPGLGRSDWPSAVSLASGLVGKAGDGGITTYAISDGAFDPLQTVGVAPGSHFIKVGSAALNLAITALSARRPPNNTPGYSAYARVENLSSTPSSLHVQALADTVPLPARALQIPAGGHADVIWQVPPGTLKLTVSLDAQDALAADNQAALFLPAHGQNKALIHSDHPDLYMRALNGYHGLQAITGTMGSEAATAFTVWEGALPASLPAGGLLLVNPSGSLLPSTGDIANVGASDTLPNHPLLADMDLGPLFVAKARKLDPPSWLDPVVQSPQGPLLLAGERDGRRIAVLTFDPHDSNLPKLAAFPLLMANLADWLYPQAGVGALHPGDSLPLPAGSTVTTPFGKQLTVDNTGLFAATGEVGVYTVKKGDDPAYSRAFSVNLTDASESNLLPRDHPELERAAVASPGKVVVQDYWSPLAAIALALAGGEWLVYCIRKGRT